MGGPNPPRRGGSTFDAAFAKLLWTRVVILLSFCAVKLFHSSGGTKREVIYKYRTPFHSVLQSVVQGLTITHTTSTQ